MATSNFITGEYGIFVLPTITEEEAAQNLEDMSIEATEDNIFNEIGIYEECMFEEFPAFLEQALLVEGVAMYEERGGMSCYDEDDRIIARLELAPGYYEGAQVLVEGNPEELLGDYYDEESYLEEYSPDITPVLNALRRITVEYKVFARFSNGETWYTKAAQNDQI